MCERAREHGAGGQCGWEGTQALAEDRALLHRDRMSEDTRKCRHHVWEEKGAEGFNCIISTKEDKRKKKRQETIAKKGILGKQSEK